MDVFLSLPEEMLREIILLLPFKDLLQCTLVCRRWHNIAERLIERKGCIRIGVDMTGHGRTLWNSNRHYRTVVVENPPGSRRSLVNLLMLPSTWIFKPLEIHLLNFLEDSLDKFCRHGHRLLEHVETVHITLDDEKHFYTNDGPEVFVLKFPAMKTLVWNENLRGRGWKMVEIDAPKLQKVILCDSLDPTAVLKIPECCQLQYVKCSLGTKSFENVFNGYLSILETLILGFRQQDFDLCILKGMPCLKWLELFFETEPSSNVVEPILCCTKLERLRIMARTDHILEMEVNMNQIFDKLPMLKLLELSGLHLNGYNPIEARKLEVLKMFNYNLSNAACGLSFNATKLHTISVCVESLSKLSIDIGNQLRTLYVFIRHRNLTESIDMFIRPFLQLHKSVQELIVRGPSSRIYNTNHVPLFDRLPLKIVRLELHDINL